MFLGGMSFSTAGGIKIFRLALFLKSIPFALSSSIGKEAESSTAGITIRKISLQILLLFFYPLSL